MEEKTLSKGTKNGVEILNFYGFLRVFLKNERLFSSFYKFLC